MAAFCVNTHSKEFKDAAGRLGISEGTLKLIAYEYGNQEETFGQFPSDNYIMSKVVGRPEMNADDAIVKIWNARYQQAQVFDTPEEFRMAKKEALRFFDADSIGVSSLPDGRIQMVVAEPNSREEPLISYLSNNEEKVIKGELGVNKQQLISLLGSTMYKSNVQSVAVKELLQNAFDAVKIAKSQGRTERSKIGITLDTANRTVTVTDNGIGMTPEIVQKAFFTIGGSYKGENVDNRLKSGGLGLAKMAFLFSSEAVDVTTVKDGIKTTVHATPDQIQNDNFNIVTSKTTESNGTTVTVKIPESYVDENGNTKTIYFENSPSFLNRPMIGDVEVSVTKVSKNWDGSLRSTTEVFDKNKIPDNYKPIGKATSEFGDIEMYIAPDDSYSIRSEVLISGLHQFSKGFELPGNQRSRFKVILNILPKVGVKSTVYPINNTREGFRATIDPEVEDIAFLLNEINHSLEKKSIAAAFGNTISMDVEEVADVKRQDTPSDILDSTIKELMAKYPKLAQSQVKSESMDNALNLNEIRMKREAKEKARRSSLDTSGIQFDKGESISAVDTSKLDVRKPMFHNNTTMVLEEDGKKVLEEFGKLMMELKSLYVQTYKDAGLESRFSKDPNSWWGNKIPLMDYLEKQFWGVSFDKGYGGVNVSPVVMPMLAVNPFYRVQAYKGVDTALALTEYITHLIIHEFNHNYQGGEDAGFTGRFPATYAEFAGIGKAFTKDWKNKLYLLIRDNLETFIKYNKRYEEATNLGESFKGDNLTAREESEGPRTENDGRDLFWNRSGEDVYGKVQTSPERRTIDLQRELEDDNIYHLTDDNTGSRKLYTKEEQELLDKTPTDDTSISVAFEGNVAEGIQTLRSKVAEIEESYGFKPNSAIPNIGTVNAQQSDSYRTYIKDLQDKIIAKLQETGYNIKVEQDSNITSELAVKSDGQTIILKYNSAKLAKNPRVFEYGVAHELVHTVTAQAIEHSFESSFNPNKEEVDFTNTVLRIANAARKEGITFNIDFQTNKERYAAEFIANAMTNPAMQDRLADIKDPKGKSLWQKFVSAVKNLISKFLGKSISDTYLDTLVSATYAHIEEFNSHRPFGQDSLTSSVQGSEFVNHSGGAIGSDTYWGEVGEKYGVKSNHYYHGAKTPNGNVAITEEQFNEGKEKVLLANKTLNRKPDRYMDLLARNWMQVKSADAVFAVGHLVNGIVDGGTGWAVQMAIDAGKPVYVFDQERGQWYKNIGGKWSESEVPALTKNFAGIGTRQLNEAGKQAIAEAYNKTFGTPQQTSLNIWAGREGRENEDLSNMAIRPFQYDGRSYNSVEQAFQLAKLRFASDITRQPVDVQEAANNPDLTSFDARRIGKHIRGLDVARWDAEKYGIMKDLIRASFQQNPQALARLLSTGDAVLTHNQETSDWKTEFPRILMEVRSELRAAQQQVTVPENNEPMWAPPSVEREFHEKEQTIVTKISNLLSSGDVTVTEVREEANKLMDWISDQLTQYQENPELVWEKFYRDAVGNTLTREQVIEKVSKMSRRDLVENIHFDVLLNHYAEEVLSQTDENSELFEVLDFDELDKLDALKENINGLAEYGFNRFVKREGFGIKLSDVEGRTFETFETSKEDQVDPDDFNSQDDVDKNSDELGNQQDHWQIENATRDIMDNAAAKVKQAVANCYVLEDNGKKNPDGTPKYDITKDKLNRNERVPDINAIRSIVRWTQGALTVEQMIDKLSAKIETNPWISQIVDMLKDEKQADFQSQFFNTFCKHFQAYSIVKRRADGTYYTMVLNANPALRDAMNTIMVQYKVGQFALVSPETGVVQSNLDAFKGIADSLLGEGDLNEENRQRVVGMVGDALVAVGFPQPADAINRILTNDLKNSVMEGVLSIHKTLTKAVGQENYNPFEFGSANGIRNYVSQLVKPFTDSLEDTMVTSLFDSGKMYQYYITPSWTTKLFQKMHLPDREFREFVLNEFGSSEWFLDPKVNMTEALSPDRLAKMSKEEQDKAILEEKLKYIQSHPNVWRTPWLRTLMSMNATERQEAFQHKVQLNFDKKNYMRGMTDLEYVMSVFTEYLADSNKGEKGVQFANYRFPMLSNKPSNEFVRFRRYEETEFDEILDGYVSIFNQEISRIQTVRTRNLMEGQEGYIANFDIGSEADRGTRGDSFKFLDYLNPYLNGEMKDEPLGKLINRKLNETEKDFLSSQELSSMETMVREKVEEHLNEVAARLIKQYEDSGLINNLKHIEGVGKSNYEVKKLIREFAWNDNFAQANLLQLLVTDKAFYKNEEDLQKRLAQVHSPGVRGNWLAKYDGKSISDGKLRVMKLGDFNETKESIIENLTAVFDQKIKDARADEVDALRALKENVLDAYRKINVVDGQAFVGPTAYRKKAIAFGEWTEEAEKTYNALKEGKANIATLQSIFNPRKPFTYGKVNKSVNAGVNTPIKTLRYGVQYKDSEYMLIMADALIRGQKSVAKKTADGKLKEVVSGRPNLLGAIFDVLEKSAELNPTMGIDFVVFESGVKTGLSGAVSLNEFVNDPNGREGAFTKMWNSVFLGDGQYNQAFVDILDAEDYTTQQAVPEHFMHGDLQWGSQVRVIMPSDLETSYNGQPVVYEFKDPATGEVVKMNKEQIRAAWEENTAKMIRDGVEKLSKELGLDATTSIADRNILISKLLQREILSNSRYGVDLLLACSVDEDGNFRIPLGDPVQSKRVEQLLNSLIKKRINRQKVAGGMLVEVTNFGTSKRLNIRFFDKNGGLLDTRQEYLAKGHTEEEFQTYVKENQNGISHYECFAPAWSREFFQSFADESGNIDVEAIEMLDPDLLKMFGYRLPTEDKYSTAPYKIVGFLPKEAGDGFMQPYETTTIDGSDFDVDKKNLMRMVLDLKSRLLSKKDFYEREGIAEETEETLAEFKKYRARAVSAKAIYNKLLDEYGTTGNITLTTAEREEAEWYEESRKNRRLDVAKVQAINAEDEAVEDVDYRDDLTETYTTFNGQEITYQPLQKTIDELESREDLTSEDEKRIERYKARLKKIQNKYSEKERQIEDDAVKYKERAINNAKKEKKIEKIRELLQQGIFRDSSTVPANQRSLFRAVKKAYIQTLFTVERPAEGTKDYYNNKMFNMQWAIATHPSTTSQMLNPGNFDPQKKIGYMVAANKLGYAWEDLEGLYNKTLQIRKGNVEPFNAQDVKEKKASSGIDAIKKLVFTNKNLMDFDIQTQFYRQNAVASQILGIFAVAKSAHAMFESRNYGLMLNRPFVLDGMVFNGLTHYDDKFDRSGVNTIGKTLGSLVSASADAVKDPVLNFMNINKETVNILNTALRLGVDFETAALLLSSDVVTKALERYRRESLIGKSSFDKVVKAELRTLEGKSYIGADSGLRRQNLSRKEMVWALTNKVREGREQRADEINYKILNAVLALSEASKTIQPLSDFSRLNSVSSSTGPLHINTLVSDEKLGPSASMKNIVKFKERFVDKDGYVPEYGELVNGVVLTPETAETLVNAGVLERFEDYEDATWDMVFNELPSIREFYKSYEIAKSLFKDLGFTTASDTFMKVLMALPQEFKFAFFSKEKLQSSLADFFQSYLLVESGVIKSSELKRYTEDFVKDFMTDKYKEKYADNPLIQAIQPKLISKEGQPDRYALEIDTTGMEQSEKDLLSAGWAQLEKVDTELSHKLFAYNFFRGGIGFNPKSFMGLVPIQVKERIAGYIETFRNIPDTVDPYKVIDQWARNNWNNTDLVTRLVLDLEKDNLDHLSFEGTDRAMVRNSLYVKVVTKENGDLLYRRTSPAKAKVITFERIEPLGNNGEYLEMYPSNQNVTALEDPNRGVFTLDDAQIADRSIDEAEVEPTEEEEVRELADFYAATYGEEETAETRKERLDEEFDKVNKDLEIQTNKDKFDEILDQFC